MSAPKLLLIILLINKIVSPNTQFHALSTVSRGSVGSMKILFRPKWVPICATTTALAVVSMNGVSQAAVFKATATTSGVDTGLNRISEDLDGLFGIPLVSTVFGANSFFSITVDQIPENVFVSSFTIDLTETKITDPGRKDDAFFAANDLGFDATPKLGQTANIDPSEISFSPVVDGLPPDPLGPSSLTISFSDQACGAGCSFAFGAETDSVSDDFFAFLVPFEPILEPIFGVGNSASEFNDNGADFGNAGVKFLVELSDGSTDEAIFDRTGLLSSAAVVSVDLPGSDLAPSSSTTLEPSGLDIEGLLETILVLIDSGAGEAEFASLLGTTVDEVIADIGENEFNSYVDGLLAGIPEDLDEDDLSDFVALVNKLTAPDADDDDFKRSVRVAARGIGMRLIDRIRDRRNVSVPEPASMVGLLTVSAFGLRQLKRKRVD